MSPIKTLLKKASYVISEMKNSKAGQLRFKKANDCNVNIVFWIQNHHNKLLAQHKRNDSICSSTEKIWIFIQSPDSLTKSPNQFSFILDKQNIYNTNHKIWTINSISNSLIIQECLSSLGEKKLYAIPIFTCNAKGSCFKYEFQYKC